MKQTPQNSYRSTRLPPVKNPTFYSDFTDADRLKTIEVQPRWSTTISSDNQYGGGVKRSPIQTSRVQSFSGGATSRRTLQAPWSKSLIRKVRKVKEENRLAVFSQQRIDLLTRGLVGDN